MSDVVTELKREIETAEADGSQVIGIHLTAEMAKAIRWELHLMYGKDPGEELILLYGAEVLSHDADKLTLVT